MAVENTKTTLTVDANVFNYFLSYELHKTIPPSIDVKQMDLFTSVLNSYKLASNEFILSEYSNCAEHPLTQYFLKEKLKNNQLVDVPLVRLSETHRNCLREEYNFNLNNDDMKYIETCNNTEMKILVTHNTKHFNCLHISGKKRKPMDKYLRKELNVKICDIDECCCFVKESLVETLGEASIKGEI